MNLFIKNKKSREELLNRILSLENENRDLIETLNLYKKENNKLISTITLFGSNLPNLQKEIIPRSKKQTWLLEDLDNCIPKGTVKKIVSEFNK